MWHRSLGWIVEIYNLLLEISRFQLSWHNNHRDLMWPVNFEVLLIVHILQNHLENLMANWTILPQSIGIEYYCTQLNRLWSNFFVLCSAFKTWLPKNKLCSNFISMLVWKAHQKYLVTTHILECLQLNDN